ncbi:MAG TPA: type II toxin-antitoxin system VapC family toxin [Thermoanaerobaculia bacterium]|nr:type II toxin-antitoxin system VapC family toxin [Thermoanaerobaculia bacterium]
MSLRFLLDTNVVSEPVRLSPNRRLLRRLQRHTGVMGIGAPTWHELKFGCERLPQSRRKEQLDDYLATVIRADLPILPYDEAAAAWHARERARLLALGRTPSFVDGQIAAIASVNDLILVTANRSDFAAFEGLRLEDWLS